MEKDTIIPTKNGCVRLSSKHWKNGKKANVAIATYLANKYGYDIDLLPDIQNEVSADTLNRTLCKLQEYKDNLTASRNAVDLQLKKAHEQAGRIKSDIAILQNAIVANYFSPDTLSSTSRMSFCMARKFTMKYTTQNRHDEDFRTPISINGKSIGHTYKSVITTKLAKNLFLRLSASSRKQSLSLTFLTELKLVVTNRLMAIENIMPATVYIVAYIVDHILSSHGIGYLCAKRDNRIGKMTISRRGLISIRLDTQTLSGEDHLKISNYFIKYNTSKIKKWGR